MENGKGKLHLVWYDCGKEDVSTYGDYSFALMLGDTPLVQIQSDGCPTCASLLAAGFGLPEDSCEVIAMCKCMNQPYTGLADALERLQPLLTLLQSGVYILMHSKHCPTDGKRFFWDVPATFDTYPATAQNYYYDMQQTLPAFPCFLYPTQGAHKYDINRVEYYRNMIRQGQSLPPVLTYSLEASMCLLLDGHHRVCACALEGIYVPSLTITRCGGIWRDGVRYVTWPDESEINLTACISPNLEQLLDTPICKSKRKNYPFSVNDNYFSREWEPHYAKMAAHYTTHYDIGMLGFFLNVEPTANAIRKLAMSDDLKEADAAANFLHYAAKQQDANIKELAMEFAQPGYPTQVRKAAFELLSSLKNDPEVDDLMVDILVSYENKSDPIYQIANKHWDIESN